MNCTAENCELETDRYLCNDCVAELDAAMSKIPDLLPVLAMITRKEEQPFTVRANRGGGKPGPTTPLNLVSHALWETLSLAQTLTPDQYAGDSEGAYAKVRIEDAVTRAEAMVHGEDEKTVTDDYLNFRMTQVTPMTATSLANWFHESMGVTIKPSRIWKWAERGNISRANTQGHPTYHPADVLRAHYETKAA